MVFLSPMLAFTSVLQSEVQVEEMDCCLLDTVEEQDEHACCAVEDTEESSNDCDDNQCHPNNCLFSQVTVFPVFIPENSLTESIFIGDVEKTKIDAYQFSIIKDLADSTWKPPKYIS